jgi:hypothetical protein
MFERTSLKVLTVFSLRHAFSKASWLPITRPTSRRISAHSPAYIVACGESSETTASMHFSKYRSSLLERDSVMLRSFSTVDSRM